MLRGLLWRLQWLWCGLGDGHRYVCDIDIPQAVWGVENAKMSYCVECARPRLWRSGKKPKFMKRA